MSYLKFNTQEDFDIWHSQINQALGYPNNLTKTYQYTNILPTNDGTIICLIEERCPIQYLQERLQYNYEEIKDCLIN